MLFIPLFSVLGTQRCSQWNMGFTFGLKPLGILSSSCDAMKNIIERPGRAYPQILKICIGRSQTKVYTVGVFSNFIKYFLKKKE